MRVLITGMSGAGKSSVVAELRRRGHAAHDVDDGYTFLDAADGRWHWDLAAIRALRPTGAGPLFIAGCSEEQTLLAWDVRVLLTAPVDVLMDRIASRPSGHGKTARERDQVLADVQLVEPLLRASADVVVDTTDPLAEVVEAVMRAAAVSG